MSSSMGNVVISSSEVDELVVTSSILPTIEPTQITITEYPNLPSFIPVYISVRFAMNLETFEANEQQLKESIADQLTINYNTTFTNESVIIINITEIETGSAGATTDQVVVNFYITREPKTRSVDSALTRYIGSWLLTLLQNRNDGLLGTEFTGKLLQVSIISSTRVDGGVVIAITLSAFAAAILIIAFVYWLQSGHQNLNRSFRAVLIDHEQNYDDLGYLNPNLEMYETNKMNQVNSQMDKSALADRLRSGNALRLEFEEIPTMVSSNSELPPNIERKNRFVNVVPNKQSRVNLRPVLGDVTSEYINANYVRGYLGKPRCYIATQAPLTNTVTDFWRMIWENNCKVILMATALEINGTSQSTQYWPTDNEVGATIKAGPFLVTLHNKEIYDTYSVSTLNLQNSKRESIFVQHYWYTKWPVDNFPSDEESTVNLLLTIRKETKEFDTPLVVHCNNGIGRTGVLLALDICMRSYDDCRKVDIKKCVERLREDRGGCVQTFDQYNYIYKTMYYYANKDH